MVLDGYGRQIPSILKQLHDLGCIVTTINASRLDVGCTSRYPQRAVIVKGIREDKVIYEKAIRKELKKNKYDVVFPMLEPSTEIMHKLKRQGVLRDIKLIAAPYEAFVKAYDKQLTMETCMDNGIPCPITKRDSETLDEFLSKVSFPLAAKPRKGSGGAGFKRIKDRQELGRYISEGTIRIEEYVIQELIPKGGLQYGGYVMMDKNHIAQAVLVVESCRWFPIDGGPGCFIRTINDPVMIESSKKLLEKIGWSSFGHIGFIMDPRDNTPKVMEINGRIPASIKICDWAGTEPVRRMLELAYNVPIDKFTKEIPMHLALRYFHTDIMWFLKSPDRFKTKPSWFDFKNSKDYIFSWSDPLPFFSYAIEHVLTYKKDMDKRRH